MRLLFIGPGYPNVPGALSGSGIGVYLREITLGLSQLGHECDVIVWGNGDVGEEDGSPLQECYGATGRPQVCEALARRLRSVRRVFRGVGAGCHVAAPGVTVHVLANDYWPIIERWFPTSRDAWNLRLLASRLDRSHRFDWVEVVSDEGIGMGVQRDMDGRVVLRLATTLAQMRESKRFPDGVCARRRLKRERRSIAAADRLVTHSQLHAAEMKSLYGLIRGVKVIPLGVEVESPVIGSLCRENEGERCNLVRVLMVGTMDRRKGFDRLRAVVEAYVREYGGLEVTIVSHGGDGSASEFGLTGTWPASASVVWLSAQTDVQLAALYERSDVLLHLARYESYGLPLIEAAAHGLPVVTTNVGIAPELMAGDLEGFIVGGDDPVACAQAIRAASLDKSRLGALLKNRYATCYTRRRMVDSYLQMLAAWRGGAV